ncbi:cysteine desulfurase family protein [Jiulongibacter sp. NS-SX5]|uniref:cysteine desulfurase family protein n=1 Tax=Jiulongibacter sp. NS-SX5 TaxID=3463854 RepID=UPI004059E4B1
MKASDLPIYLDFAATTPVDPAVMESMLPWFTESYGNAASRFHAYGWLAEEAVDEAKKSIAKLSGFGSKEVIFTSGATESINLALTGFFEKLNFKGKLVTVQTEHKATIDTAHYLAEKGVEVVYLPVNEAGQIDLQELQSHLASNTRLVSIMQVNNETGVLLPVDKVIDLCKEKDIKVHIDATQGAGKLAIPNADFVSFSAHKIYGPKGMGCLLAKKDIAFTPQIHGGKHQRNRRSGTLNVAGIVGLAEALKLAESKREKEHERLNNLTQLLENSLKSALDKVQINAEFSPRVPGISNICFKGVDGEEILLRMSKIAVSNGSACNSASTEPSYVLRAMGLSEADAFSSIRFSLGRFTTEEQIKTAVEHVIQTVKAF